MHLRATRASCSLQYFAVRCVIYALVSAGLHGLQPAFGQPLCRPMIRLGNAHISAIDAATMRRTWRATASIDASACKPRTGGRFDIDFVQLKENGPDLVSNRSFAWRTTPIEVAIDVAADEAIGKFWVGFVGPCACRR